jgi:predicted SnoaL-like aldol condensation-catalyzing enzyme
MDDRAEHNKRLVMRHFLEAVGERKPEVWLSILHPDYVIHHPWVKPGRDSYMAASSKYWAAISAPKYDFLHILSEGDLVMVHYIERATLIAPLFGVEPNGKSYEKGGFGLYRIEDGLMREGWNQEDDLGFMKQLGISEYVL